MTFALTALLCLAAETVTAPAAQAADYWVATNGNDSSNGSQGSPWRTFQKAINTIRGGDTVLFRAGTYDGFDARELHPPAGQWITLKPDAGAKVTINTSQKNVSFRGASYIILEGFEITNLNYPHNLVHSCNLRNDPSGNCRALAQSLRGGGSSGISFYGTKPANAKSANHHIIIRNNNIHHHTNYGMSAGGMDPALGSHHDLQILNNEIHHNGIPGLKEGYGVYLRGHRLLVRGNVSHHNTGNNLRFGTSDQPGIGTEELFDSIIERNISYENEGPWLHAGSSGVLDAGFGIVIWGGVGNIVRNNLVFNTRGTGIGDLTSEGSPRPDLVYNNTIYGNGGTGLELYRTTVARNNIVWGNGKRIPAYQIRTIANHTGSIEYNLVGGGNLLIDNRGSGTESNNIRNADPMFVNPGAGDFHLQAGSAAIDKGTTLAQVPNDFDAGKRPFGAAYDIGAFEHGAPPGTDPGPGLPPGDGGITLPLDCPPIGIEAAGNPFAPTAPGISTPPVMTGATTTPLGTGKNYYMSPSGNDNNPGTEAAPWRTLDKVHAVRATLRPGDTVWFRGGDYVITDANRSYYVLGGSGTAAAPIIYRNYQNEKPVIIYDRTTADNAATAGSPNMIFAQDYAVIDGLHFRQTERSRLQGMNGNALVARGGRKSAFAVYGDGVTIRNCSIDNFSNVAIGNYGGSGLLVEHCAMTDNGAHAFYIASRNGTYRYNSMDGRRGYPGQYNIHFQYAASTGNKVYGNLSMNAQAGDTVFSGGLSNNEVFNNVIINGGSKTDGSYGYALTFFCQDSLSPSTGNKFYNNTIIGKSNTGLVNTRVGIPAGGSSCLTSSGGRPLAERVQIYNNIFHPSQPPQQTLTAISTMHDNIFYNIRGGVPAGNTLVNPNLAKPNGTTATDAMLQAGSPAIDKAVATAPALDYQGGMRPVGAAADIGAYEFGAPPGPLGGPLGGGGGSTGGGSVPPGCPPPFVPDAIVPCIPPDP